MFLLLQQFFQSVRMNWNGIAVFFALKLYDESVLNSSLFISSFLM
uniref:Uncharacterized protein n=1 Tax=Anguilla anguilla TaxID=7936 RepID=A0A0E9XD48_ANGAN